jgi:hypothetical protein
MNNETDAAPITLLLSPAEVWDRVDPLASDLGADPAVMRLGELPYAKLLGPGFERLCYELLVAENFSPRFFGRSGQQDYGVDIIVETGEIRSVYQCKNVADAPRWTEVRDAIKNSKPIGSVRPISLPHSNLCIALPIPWTTSN